MLEVRPTLRDNAYKTLHRKPAVVRTSLRRFYAEKVYGHPARAGGRHAAGTKFGYAQGRQAIPDQRGRSFCSTTTTPGQAGGDFTLMIRSAALLPRSATRPGDRQMLGVEPAPGSWGAG